MTAHDSTDQQSERQRPDDEEPREDVPEADWAEQRRELVDDAAGSDVTVDPLSADAADQLEQAVDVPDDEEYDRP